MKQASILKNKETLQTNVGNSAQLFYKLYHEANPKVPHYHWETPIEFDKYDLPIFDVSVFSKEIQEMILTVSDFNQTPVDLAAFCALGAVGKNR